MFERYLEPARRVIFFARYEASLRPADAIEPEHLLIGLLREDQSLVSDKQTLLNELSSLYPNQGTHRSTSVDMPLSAASKRVLAYAAEEAERMSHRTIGTGHLFLGLLRDDNKVAQLLKQHGFELNAMRDKVRESFDDERESGRHNDRQTLHFLIARIPESKLTEAERLLRNLLDQ